MNQNRRMLAALAIALSLTAGCGHYHPASYPGQDSIPPATAQPLNVRLGVIPYGEDEGGRRTGVIDQIRASGLFRSVDAAAYVPVPGFDLVLDLRGMGMQADRFVEVDSARTGKRLYRWQPLCGSWDAWCINAASLANDVAWLFASGTKLHADFVAEAKKPAPLDADALSAEPAPEEPAATPTSPAGGQKSWWETGSAH